MFDTFAESFLLQCINLSYFCSCLVNLKWLWCGGIAQILNVIEEGLCSLFVKYLELFVLLGAIIMLECFTENGVTW